MRHEPADLVKYVPSVCVGGVDSCRDLSRAFWPAREGAAAGPTLAKIIDGLLIATMAC